MAPRMTSFRFISLAAIFSSLLSGTFAIPKKHYHEDAKIKFTPCADFPGLECGTYTVPVDWNKPKGEQLDLQVYKAPATSNTTKPVGNVYFSWGGPGVPGSGLLFALAGGIYTFPAQEELFANFNVIAVDPRGTGLSNQVKCDMSIWAERVSLAPKTEEEYKKMVDKARRLGNSCRKLTGPVFDHLDIVSNVKDIEAVRKALGGPMNLIGISYGTAVAAKYADMYPNQVRTIVLDAPVQYSLPEAAAIGLEANGMAASLAAFFEYATTIEPLKGKDVKALWNELLARARKTPIPAKQCNGITDCAKDVTAEEIIVGAQNLLLWRGERGHPLGGEYGSLAWNMFDALQGDATNFSRRNDDDVLVSHWAIGCNTYPREGSSSWDLEKTKMLLGEQFPLTQGVAENWYFQHACQGVNVRVPPHPKLHITSKAPVLIAVTTRDQYGLYAHGLGLQEDIENNSLLVSTLPGHTVWLQAGDGSRVITKYLISGKAPRTGLIVSS